MHKKGNNFSESVLHPFTAAILSWFRENGRSLPWRETKDPYAVWLSEIILQQTRVSQGQAYWERFMRQYPCVENLAAASEDDVLRLWQGLGYYSRARNLLAAARQIADMGHFPDTYDTIRALKGVGDYTAAAIASIAFDLPTAVVDGNVYRVLSRYFGIDTPIDTTKGKKEFSTLAQSLLPPDKASAFNQAMMDFGAIQCTPKSPDCAVCPLSATCEAQNTGRTDELPVKQKTLSVKTRYLTYVYIRHAGMTAIHRRKKGDIWAGLWEPYNASVHEDTSPATPADLTQVFPEIHSGSRLTPVATGVKHLLTHRRLIADFYLLETDRRPSLPPDYIWIEEADIQQYGIPRLIEIFLEKLVKRP